MRPRRNTRERLVTVALQSIWKKSCAAVSVDAICREARVNKGSFYHFFESKSAIILATIDAAWRTMREDVLEPAFDPEFNALERIERLFERAHNFQKEQKAITGFVPGCLFCNVGSELSTLDESIRVRIEEILSRHVAYIESALREAKDEGRFAGDPLRVAKSLFSYLEGLILRAKIQNNPDLIIELAPELPVFIGLS